jgi:hypothetical protein
MRPALPSERSIVIAAVSTVRGSKVWSNGAAPHAPSLAGFKRGTVVRGCRSALAG